MKPFFPDTAAGNNKNAEIHRFQNNLDRYETLLERMKGKDLRSFKVTTAFGPVLKFYAGDAMHFIHAHNLRHAQQVKNILSQVSVE